MFAELIHDLQYYSLSWIFQRRLSKKHGLKISFLPGIFRTTQALLILYLLVSFTYGAVFSNFLKQFFDERHLLIQVTLAILYAMTIFHFYTDGFIWKVRQSNTREYFGIAQRAVPANSRAESKFQSVRMRSRLHLACYAVIVGVLWVSHSSSQKPSSKFRSLKVAETLAKRMPEFGDAHHVLGFEYQQRGRIYDAIHEYQIAMKFGVQKQAELCQRLSWAFQVNGDYDKAIFLLRESMDTVRKSKVPQLAGQLALLLAECPQQEFRNGQEAVRLAKIGSSISGPRKAFYLDILAAAYSEAREFESAIRTAEQALLEAEKRDQTNLAQQIRQRIVIIKKRQLEREDSSG